MLSCIHIDVNCLHELNDTKEHQARDEMLGFVAHVLRDALGREDTYRIGEGEFVVLWLTVT